MRASTLLLLGAACVSGMLAGCQKEPPPKVEVPRPVRTVVAQLQPVGQALVLPAEIRPRIEIRYGFRVGGKLSQRLVSVGDRVEPGQLLARLDPQDAAPAVEAARAALEAAATDARLAETELARLRELREKNFISAAQLDRQQAVHDSARSRVQSAEASLKQARNAVEFQQLRADAPGHVVAVDAEAGQVVAAGQSVIRVAKSGEIEAALNVPERDIGAVRSAAMWQVVVPALDGRVLQGKVRELSPVSDPASRTYPVRLTLSGDLSGLALGMTATAASLREASSAFQLPISALYSKDGKSYVWVVDAQGAVAPVQVETVGLGEDTVRIASGIKAGDRVVTAGANLLVPGQKVRLVNAPPQAAAQTGVAR